MIIAFTGVCFLPLIFVKVKCKEILTKIESKKPNFHKCDHHETFRIFFFRQNMQSEIFLTHSEAIYGYLPYKIIDIFSKIAYFPSKLNKIQYETNKMCIFILYSLNYPITKQKIPAQM